MATKKTGITIGGGAFVSEREAVIVPCGEDGSMLTLFAHRLGCLEVTDITGTAQAREESWLIPLVAASIRDEDGNRFTVEEVKNLRKDVADPLLAAVLKVNKIGNEGSPEKN